MTQADYSRGLDAQLTQQSEKLAATELALATFREAVRDYLRSLTLMGPEITAPPQFWETATGLRLALSAVARPPQETNQP